MDAAKNGKFLSKDDFRDRTKVSKTVIDLMDDLGIFGDIPQSNQFSLFDGVTCLMRHKCRDYRAQKMICYNFIKSRRRKMKKEELRYLQRLAELYPTIGKASTEIINLQSILNLPKRDRTFHVRYCMENMRHFPMYFAMVPALSVKRSMMCLAIH